MDRMQVTRAENSGWMNNVAMRKMWIFQDNYLQVLYLPR